MVHNTLSSADPLHVPVSQGAGSVVSLHQPQPAYRTAQACSPASLSATCGAPQPPPAMSLPCSEEAITRARPAPSVLFRAEAPHHWS